MAAGERWYFTKEQLACTPSRKCGLDADKELSYRQQAANLIQDMGQRLQVTQLCINTAIVYMHRFYYYHSFTKFHRNSIAACALFLAAKVEEQPRKLEHVIKVAHMCLHRDAPPLNPASEAYQEQALELVLNENMMLQTLGFDIGIEHPHTHVVNFCQLVRASKDLAQTSYFMATNSLHLTMMCLQYKPRVVACLCIHLACKWSNWEIPKSSEDKDWFWYVEQSCTAELLEELTSEFLAILDKCPSRLKRKIMSVGAGSSGSSATSVSTPVAATPSTSGSSSRKEGHSQQKREERSAAAASSASHETSGAGDGPSSERLQPSSGGHGSRKPLPPHSDPSLHRNAKVPSSHHGSSSTVHRSPGVAQLQPSNQGAEHLLSPGKRKIQDGGSHSSQSLSLDAYRDKRYRQKIQQKPVPHPSERSESFHGAAVAHPPSSASLSQSHSRHHQHHSESTPDVAMAASAPPPPPPAAAPPVAESARPEPLSVKQEHASDDISGFNFNFGSQFGGDGNDSSIDSFSFSLDCQDMMPAISPLQFDADDRSNSQDMPMTIVQRHPVGSTPLLSSATLAEESNVAIVKAAPPTPQPPAPVVAPVAKVEPRTPPLPPVPKARPATPPLPAPKPQRPATPPLPQKPSHTSPPLPVAPQSAPPLPKTPPLPAPQPPPVVAKPEPKSEPKPEVTAQTVKEKERSERKERRERHKHKHSSSERSKNKHSSPGKHGGGDRSSEGKSHASDRLAEATAHHAAGNAVDVLPASLNLPDVAPASEAPDKKVERNGISKHDRKSSSSKSESSRKEKSERREKERREASREENGSSRLQPSSGGGLKITITKEKLQQSGSGLTGSPPREALKIKIPKLKIVPPTPTPPPLPTTESSESAKGPQTPPPPPPSTGLKLKISKERLNSGRKRDRRSEDGEHRGRSPKSRKVSAAPPLPPPPPGPAYVVPPVAVPSSSTNHAAPPGVMMPQFQAYVQAPQFVAPPPSVYYGTHYNYPHPPPPPHMAPGPAFHHVPQYFGMPPPPPPVDPPLPKEPPLPPPPPPPPSE